MRPSPTEPLAPRRPPGQDELPYDDGAEMESKRHREQASLLIGPLDAFWADRRDFFVAGNMAVYFSELQTRKNDFRGPDVFVVLGTERKERKSWVVWEEDGRAPNVVIELLSPSTEHVDRGEKMRIYASVLRVPECFLYDPDTRRLEGFRLDAARLAYVPIEPDARGDLPCAQLGLGLGNRPGRVAELEGPFLRWIGPDGEPLPTGAERAEAAEQRAESAEVRARRLADRLRAAGIDPDE